MWRARQVLNLDDFSPEDVQAILSSEPPAEANDVNSELMRSIDLK